MSQDGTTGESSDDSNEAADAGRGAGVATVTVDARARTRWQNGLKEFLTRPLLLTAVGILLAGVAILHDRGIVPWAATVRRAVAIVVPTQAAGTFVSTVTPGLLTVISIIFFVALMTMQHQSSKYSPVVIDQFLRRTTNQVFFGIFIALTVYCVLVLGAAPSQGAIISSSLGLVLIAVTLALLLVFVYDIIDQMRPSTIAWMLQGMALRARLRQQHLLQRCRTESQLREAPATNARVNQVGYIIDIDAHVLKSVLIRAQADMDQVEVELQIHMGQHVVPNSTIGQVRGGTAVQREWLAGHVVRAITVGRQRDVDHDAAHAVNQLGSMAWSATAGTGDLEGARVAVEALHGVLVLLQNDDKPPPDNSTATIDLPLVYTDPIDDKVIGGLVNVVAASQLSGQHQSAANSLTVLARSLPHLSQANQRLVIDRVERVLPTVSRHLFTVELENGFGMLRQAMHEVGEADSARRLRQIQDDLETRHRLANPD